MPVENPNVKNNSERLDDHEKRIKALELYKAEIVGKRHVITKILGWVAGIAGTIIAAIIIYLLR